VVSTSILASAAQVESKGGATDLKMGQNISEQKQSSVDPPVLA